MSISENLTITVRNYAITDTHLPPANWDGEIFIFHFGIMDHIEKLLMEEDNEDLAPTPAAEIWLEYFINRWSDSKFNPLRKSKFTTASMLESYNEWRLKYGVEDQYNTHSLGWIISKVNKKEGLGLKRWDTKGWQIALPDL